MERLGLILTFVVNMTNAVAWPVVVVWAVWILRDSLKDVVRRLSRVKGTWGEAEFKNEVNRIEAEAQKVELPPVAAIKRFERPESPEEKYRRLCEIAPEAAVTQAWSEIESAVYATFPPPGRVYKSYEIIEKLQSFLTPETLELVVELRSLRNQVSHHRESIIVDGMDAYRYSLLALRVAAKIRESGPVPPGNPG